MYNQAALEVQKRDSASLVEGKPYSTRSREDSMKYMISWNGRGRSIFLDIPLYRSGVITQNPNELLDPRILSKSRRFCGGLPSAASEFSGVVGCGQPVFLSTSSGIWWSA